MKHDDAINTIDVNFNLHATKVPMTHTAMKVVHANGLSYVNSGLSCDTFNIIHITDGSLATSESIQTAIQHFKKRKLDFCLWINEKNLSPGVRSTLDALNLSMQNQEVGMLLKLDEYSPITNDNHGKISVVSDNESLTEYAAAIAENWSPPDTNVIAYYKQTAEYYLNQKDVILLNYQIDGRTVSTVELFATDKDTIGFYGFTTLEAFRGMGIGSSLMTYSLNLAKSQGYKNAILQGTDDGLGIYRKYGFKDVTTYFEFA